MGLISQLITEKLRQFEEASLKNNYDFWNLYQSYNLSVSALNIRPNKKTIQIRNNLYKNILIKNKAEKSFVIFSNLISKDVKMINEYLKLIEQQEMHEEIYAKVYKKGAVGVLSFEVE